MYRLRGKDGRICKDHTLKALRVGSYLMMTLAGILLILSPVFRGVYSGYGTAMAVFLTTGGVLALFGSVSEKWWGEYVGLLPLSTGFAVFGVLTVMSGFDSAPFVALANLALLSSLSLGLACRWWEVRGVYRLAVHMAHREG